MPNDLTTTSPTSRPVLPSSASNDYLADALGTRCDQPRLAGALRTLLGLYFQPGETPEERARQIATFVADLSDMSEDNVWWAMREWRRTQDRRPSPASLRHLCMVRRMELTRAMASRSPVEDTAPFQVDVLTEEERAHRKAVVASAAASCGFVRNKHGQWELPEPGGKPERVPHWSETASPEDPRWIALRKSRAANALVGGA